MTKPLPSGIVAAIEKAGTQLALARRLRVTQQAVSIWRTQGWVPRKRIQPISTIYDIPVRRLAKPAK